MKAEAVKKHSLGYHKPWRRIIGRKIDCPDGFKVGPKCNKRGHHFMGKSVYRKGVKHCVECDMDLVTPKKKAPLPKPTPELVAKAQRYKDRMFDKEMAALDKENYAFGHLA